MSWTKVGGVDWIYSTKDGLRAEIRIRNLNQTFHYVIITGNTTIYQSGEMSTLAATKKSAEDVYDSLLTPPPEESEPQGILWEVILPGLGRQTTKAESPMQAVGHILYRNSDYEYKGVAVGEDYAGFRLVHLLLAKEGIAKVKPIRG